MCYLDLSLVTIEHNFLDERIAHVQPLELIYGEYPSACTNFLANYSGAETRTMEFLQNWDLGFIPKLGQNMISIFFFFNLIGFLLCMYFN